MNRCSIDTHMTDEAASKNKSQKLNINLEQSH